MGSKVKKTLFLEVAYSDQWSWKLGRILGNRGQGVRIRGQRSKEHVFNRNVLLSIPDPGTLGS